MSSDACEYYECDSVKKLWRLVWVYDVGSSVEVQVLLASQEEGRVERHVQHVSHDCKGPSQNVVVSATRQVSTRFTIENSFSGFFFIQLNNVQRFWNYTKNQTYANAKPRSTMPCPFTSRRILFQRYLVRLSKLESGSRWNTWCNHLNQELANHW